MAWHSAIFRFCWPAGDHHLLAHVRPRFGLGPRPRYAQCPPGAQTAHQLALEGSAPLDVEGLVDGFVRNTHGFVIREVDLQPVGDLFGRPGINPMTVTAMWLVTTLERCLPRADNLAAMSVMYLALQAVLDIVAQLRVTHQLCLLRSSGHQFCLPLRD
jgi:hypothetical protein